MLHNNKNGNFHSFYWLTFFDCLRLVFIGLISLESLYFKVQINFLAVSLRFFLSQLRKLIFNFEARYLAKQTT